VMTPGEIVKLADLEPREVLLAKLAGAMKASMSGAAATFAALPTQMARLLAALEQKQASEAPAGAEAQDAAAPAETQDAAPAEDGSGGQEAGEAAEGSDEQDG
jgi:large subunit ribosomal protein L10